MTTVDVGADIPPELSEWRHKHSRDGAIIQISRRGVVLHTLAARRTYPDVAAAIAAITA